MRFPKYSVALILMAWSLFLGACDDPEKEKAERDAYLKAYQESKKCDAEPVVIEIDGVEIAVPRRALVYRKEDGAKVKLKLKGKCVKRVENVQRAEWTQKTGVFRVFSLEGRDVNLPTHLPHGLEPFRSMDDGTEKAVAQKMTFYRLPLDKAPTLGKHAIIMRCDNLSGTEFLFERCEAGYAHPVGVGVQYTAPQKDYQGLLPLELDRKKREEFMAMVKIAEDLNYKRQGEN